MSNMPTRRDGMPRFANYPRPRRASLGSFEYKPEPGNNPIVRGLPLAIGAAL